MLIGRSAECIALDRLLVGGRSGRSAAVVLRGEPGVGKTALLGYAAEQSQDARVLRALGIETETELAFAGLHQLLGRDLGRINDLPEPQAASLRGAFGIAAAEERTDPFLISLAVLSLLAELAEERPLLCLVDDAQWLDAPSATALLFAARRIEAEGIVIVFAVREGEEQTFDAPGVPSIKIEALDDEDARALLETRAGDGVDAAVRERLLADAAGNPLALLELPAILTPDQLAGDEPLRHPLPVGTGLESAYLARVRRLPEQTQALLLVAAAEDSGDLGTMLRAAAAQGIEPAALEPAEREGLVSVVDGRFLFRHPLVRSAIYHGGTFAERQRVHGVLAEAQDERSFERRAWHRAAAADGPDEAIANELETAARTASERGGHAAAATTYERAAGLTADTRGRTTRLLAAADSAWLAGKAERARACLGEARHSAPDDLKVRVTELQGRIDVRSGVFANACADLMAAAEGLASTDPDTSLRLLAEAENATFYTGDLGVIMRIGELAERIGDESEVTERFAWLVLVGLKRGFAVGTEAGAPLLREALESAATSSKIDDILIAGRIAAFLGDDVAGALLIERALRLARESGAVATLPRVLAPAAWAEWRYGRYASARMYGTEALRLARETGQEPGLALCALALTAGTRGIEDECRAYAQEAMERAQQRGASLLQSQANWALGLLELALGRFDEAVRRLGQAMGRDGAFAHPALARHATPDYVEAAVRAGHRDTLRATIDEYEAWVRTTNQPWTRGLLAACRALAAEGDELEHGLSAALDMVPVARRPFEHARLQLLLGEFLRRNRKRREARDHLRSAIEGFEQLDVAPWAERARVELRASGETARKRDASTLGDLTPQELQIARLVAAGARNREVAAQLFLSPRTIDYHLRKVFMKLGIASRAELAQMELAAVG